LYWGGAGWRLGGALAFSNFDAGAGAESEDVVYGIVGTHDLGPNTVLDGSATFGEIDIFGADVDTWNIDAGLNFYTASNFRIGANIGVGNLDAGGGADADTSSGGINAEWAPFASTPVSFIAGWNHFDVDNAFLGGIETDTLSIGARWNFGGGSLRERDNSTPFETRTALYPRAFDLH
jgi:hypothetical protein